MSVHESGVERYKEPVFTGRQLLAVDGYIGGKGDGGILYRRLPMERFGVGAEAQVR